MRDNEKRFRQGAFYRILRQAEREKWDKINDRFEKNDRPAGCKLTAVGCMKRFEHASKEEMFNDNKRELGNNIEEYKEKVRLELIEPDMSLEEIDAILNPREEDDEDEEDEA
jgi:hypothetical protein